MKLIDLSHPQEFGMPVYPGAEALFAGLPLNICGPGGSPVPAVAKVPC
jgi:kynurenine formamidase